MQLIIMPMAIGAGTFAKGFIFLGYFVSSRSIRMGPKAEDKFKDKVRDITTRCHNLDARVVEKLNRVIRGTVNYFFTNFTNNLQRFIKLDKWIRKRIRCMKLKRISKFDNLKLLNKHLFKLGLLSCVDLCLARREGFVDDSLT